MKSVLIAILFWTLTGLANAGPPPDETAEPAFQSAIGGVRYRDLQLGEGATATVGQIATIHFIAWIDDDGVRGREVFRSRDRGQPVSFVIGARNVMPGWNAGIQGMKPGGVRLLLIPPAMAYGDRSIEDRVPAKASLMIRVELLRLEKPPKP
jgi:FKBP-type peptidyl-prolyl cis-trans isomerase